MYRLMYDFVKRKTVSLPLGYNVGFARPDVRDVQSGYACHHKNE
jgi:hypothetical protein